LIRNFNYANRKDFYHRDFQKIFALCLPLKKTPLRANLQPYAGASCTTQTRNISHALNIADEPFTSAQKPVLARFWLTPKTFTTPIENRKTPKNHTILLSTKKDEACGFILLHFIIYSLWLYRF